MNESNTWVLLGSGQQQADKVDGRVGEGKVYDIIHRTKFFHEFDPVRSSDWPLRGRSMIGN